jgi:hypothetical protein
MTTKKKTHSQVESSSQARPGYLIVALILAACASTWYWYRPLTSETLVDGNHSKDMVDFFGKHATLIEPNTNDAIRASSTAVPVYSSLPADLVGERQVELRPFQPTPQGTLQERLSREPLPVIPISRPDRSDLQPRSSIASARPPLWTTMETDSKAESQSLVTHSVASRSGATLGTKLEKPDVSANWDSTSPFDGMASNPLGSAAPTDRIVAISPDKPKRSQWPDAQFEPESIPGHGGSIAQGAMNPPLTIRSSGSSEPVQGWNRQPGKIALSEDGTEEQIAAIPRRSLPAAFSSNTLNAVTSSTTSKPNEISGSSRSVKKSGAVIRQPKQ